MKAAVCTKYGPPEVISIQDVPKPVIKKNHLLIKVEASAVNASDARIRGIDTGGGALGFVIGLAMRGVIGLKGPRNKVLGSAIAGTVVAVGEGVDSFAVDDMVFALTGLSFGGAAEYCLLPAKRAIAHMPSNANYNQAAALPFGGSSALYFLHKAGVRDAKNILVYGATGSVGSAAVQVAKFYGLEVDAVCGKDGAALAKKLGADTVFDYKKEDYLISNKQYDIIFDAVGKISKKKVAHMLRPDSRYTTVDSMDVAKEYASDLELLAKMFEDGKYDATIDRIYALDQIVEAHAYVDSKRKKGNVVIDMSL